MSDISALPVDLWLSIFQKSKAKTLGVCKCVCKRWCNIISSPYFINYHLNLSYLSPSSSSTNLRRQRRRSKEANRTFPMLWNPTTRKCMVLWTIGHDVEFSRLVDGFGFGPNSNDYKYVMISEDTSKPRHSPPMVHVYSIAGGCWRSFPYTTNLPHLRVGCSGYMVACVNGVMYWKIPVHGIDKAVDKHGQEILTFDIRKEEFVILELPKEEVEELEEDMYTGRKMFESCNEYNMESLVFWDKQAKPTPWSRGVSVIRAEDLDIESPYCVAE